MVLILWSISAGALTCEGRKAKVTAAYVRCRFEAIESAARNFLPPDFSNCEERFATQWARVDSKDDCLTPGNASVVKDIADNTAADLANAMLAQAVSYCGNGAVDTDEDCDAQNLNGATCESLGYSGGTLACTPDCQFETSGCVNELPARLAPSLPYKRAFVTSLSYTGDLGGVAGADAKCNAAASAAGLGGTWAAWLSTPTMNAWERLPESEYRRLDGALIATGLGDLIDGSLANPIRVTEFGAQVTKNVWTGTAANGTYLAHRGNDCMDWTYGISNDDLVSAIIGNSERVDAYWSTKAGMVCYATNGLYCFEL